MGNQSAGYLAPQVSATGRYGGGGPSVEADLPLTQSAALPAGFDGPSTPYAPQTSHRRDESQNYSFSSPAHRPPRSNRFQGLKEQMQDVDWTFGLGRGSKADGLPREVALNDPVRNKSQKWRGNSVSTRKYNPVTFVPKFLFSEFSKAANLFFLFTGELQQASPRRR